MQTLAAWCRRAATRCLHYVAGRWFRQRGALKLSAEFTHFGTTREGELVHRIVIRSPKLEVAVLTWGAVLQDVRLQGIDHPLTLGAPDLAAYEGKMISFGALMGPVVNRIRNARVPIAGVLHELEANLDGAHTIHGGSLGTQHRVWTVLESSPSHVLMETELPDGQSGFPGNRAVRVDYRVAGARLDMVVTGTTDAPTLMNFANHSYWNLDGAGTVDRHVLRIPADRMTVNDDDLIVTGELRPVDGTRFDFRVARPFDCGPQNRFDINFCLSDNRRALAEVAEIAGQSGVRLRMLSTEPGLQVFDLGSFGTDPHPGHCGAPYPRFSGLALEAQAWPDAANHSGFPSIEVAPDRPYHQHTAWCFDRD